MPSTKAVVLLPAVAAWLAACTADGSGPSRSAQVTLHVATQTSGSASLPSVLGQPDTLIAGRDTLILDQVEVVLRDIRFDRVEDDGCDGGDLEDGVPGGERRPAHDDDGDGDESCEHFRTGPILVDLPLGPGVDRVLSVAVEPGIYDEIRFKIHKPGRDGPADAAFLALHPEFAGVSIRVTGSFNGVPFTFLSDLDEKQEQALVPPLVVTGGATQVDVTLRVDLHTWFGDGGGGLVDPATANRGGPNERLVRDNIRDSFRAFRDDDHDGEDDGDDHHESDNH